MPDTDPDFALDDNTLTQVEVAALVAGLPAAPEPPAVRVHPTAIIEPGVSLGRGTSVWDGVHIRHDATLGEECIVGEKTYIAYGVRVGNRVKINSFVYICAGVRIDDGVMVSAGVIFTNDRFPRATTPDLKTLRPSDPDEHTRPTWVREGATIGAGCTIGNDLTIGRFAMVGMGALVTKGVPDFALAIGHPAVPVGAVCRCGQVLFKHAPGRAPTRKHAACSACGREYGFHAAGVVEYDAEPLPNKPR